MRRSFEDGDAAKVTFHGAAPHPHVAVVQRLGHRSGGLDAASTHGELPQHS